jgi:hypothetical protein
MYYKLRSSHSSRFDHSNSIGWGEQIIIIIIIIIIMFRKD